MGGLSILITVMDISVLLHGICLSTVIILDIIAMGRVGTVACCAFCFKELRRDGILLLLHCGGGIRGLQI